MFPNCVGSSSSSSPSISFGMCSAASALSLSNVLSTSPSLSGSPATLVPSPRNHKTNTTTSVPSSHSLASDLSNTYGTQLGYYGGTTGSVPGDYYPHPAMYHHNPSSNAMDNWHHPYNPLGHFYRGYEAAAAMAEWPMVHAQTASHEQLNGVASAADLLNSGPTDPYGYRLSSDVGIANHTSPRSPPEYKTIRDTDRHLDNGGNGPSPRVSAQDLNNLTGVPLGSNNGMNGSSGGVEPGPSSQSPRDMIGEDSLKCDGPDSPGSADNDSMLHSRPMQSSSPYKWLDRSGYQQRIGAKEGATLLSHSSRTRTKDKYRVVYSDHQRLELEKEFHYSRYITIRRKAELAQALNLSERQVKIWFQNRRAKERKHMKKRDEIIQKEKLDAASSLHAVTAAAAGHHAAVAASANHMFAMGPMSHMLHPGMPPHL